jgi:hypothetical protein
MGVSCRLQDVNWTGLEEDRVRVKTSVIVVPHVWASKTQKKIWQTVKLSDVPRRHCTSESVS